MRKAVLMLLALALALTCIPALAESNSESSALIAYFTYAENINTTGMTVDAITSASVGPIDNETGNIQVMVQALAERTHADVHPIVVENLYAAEYTEMHDGAIEEQRQSAVIPLRTDVENMEQYDVIYLGTPIWEAALPQPVVTFLSQYDFSGKTIILFGINLGSGFGGMARQIQELCPDAQVADYFTISARTSNAETRSRFETWLDEIGVPTNGAETKEAAIRMTFGDGTIGIMTDLRDNATTHAFLDMLPMTITMRDWDSREYWYSDTLPYDESSVQHTYAIGEFTYWCGGWVTAYYSTNEDTVIEAGSVVIGIMDDAAVQQFANANGASLSVAFEYVPVTE